MAVIDHDEFHAIVRSFMQWLRIERLYEYV